MRFVGGALHLDRVEPTCEGRGKLGFIDLKPAAEFGTLCFGMLLISVRN